MCNLGYAGDFEELETFEHSFWSVQRGGDFEAEIYWFSYGTTSTTSYPEDVSRIVPDGRVNAKDRVVKWQFGHLNNTDTIHRTFYTGIFEAKESGTLCQKLDSDPVNILHITPPCS